MFNSCFSLCQQIYSTLYVYLQQNNIFTKIIYNKREIFFELYSKLCFLWQRVKIAQRLNCTREQNCTKKLLSPRAVLTDDRHALFF